MALAQWLVPLRSMIGSERVLTDGTPFLFRTAPVDPFDWFRGEYVTLRFALEEKSFPMTDGPITVSEPVYAILEVVDGEAAISMILPAPPTDGSPFLICTIAELMSMDSATARIDLPFDRYYVEQGDGPKVEELMRRNFGEGGTQPTAFAKVRVLDGKGVIEDLIIDGRSIDALLHGSTGPVDEPVTSEPI